MGRQIKDTPANDEVFLTRKFGDEKCVVLSFPHFRLIGRANAMPRSIRVMFSIADLQSIPDEDEPEPEATDDEGPARRDEPALRVSVAITKVRVCRSLILSSPCTFICRPFTFISSPC
jgi:hypothetical protein